MSNEPLFIKVLGEGPPLVLFHGWGFDHSIWFSISSDLSQRFTLYLIDLPGFGHSDCMTWETFKTILIEKLPSDFALLGWSLGGLYAMRFAIEEPEYVSKLVITTSSPFFLKAQDWPGIEQKVLQTFFNQLQSNPQATLTEFINLQMPNDQCKTDINYLASLAGMQQGLIDLGSWDLRSGLSDLSKPACFIFGRLDSIVPYTTLNAMQVNYPQFNYVPFPKAAHMPFLSHTQDFLMTLEQFLL